MTCHDTYDFAAAGGLSSPRIVVGIDGSEASVAALRWAADQVRTSGSTLELVHVYTSESPYTFTAGGIAAVVPCDPMRVRASAQAVLRQAMVAAGVAAPGARLTTVDAPSATRALMRAAEGASMLVLGAHRRHGLGIMLGSTAAFCVRNAGCPVVVVPASARVTARQASPRVTVDV